MGERVYGRGVAPVQVLEHDNERPLASERLECPGELTKHPLAVRARHAARERLRAGGVEESGHLQEPARRPALERGDDLAPVGLGAEAIEQVEQRQVRLAPAAELDALAE